MTQFNKSQILFLVIVLIALSIPVNAEPPQKISYQGRLTDGLGDPVPDDNYLLTFTIYTKATSGFELWSSGQQSVSVVNGLFNYILGSVVPIPDSVFSTGDQYLGITVGANPEISPRTPFSSSAYSLVSKTVVDDAITSDKILDGSIIRHDIGEGQVHSSHINDGTILSEDIHIDAITSNEILDGTITGIDISTNAIGTSKIIDGAITNDKIFDGTIQEADMANDAITSDKILNNTIAGVDISPNTIASSRIVDGTITADDIATDAVGADAIATNAVGNAELTANAASGYNIVDEPGIVRSIDNGMTIASGDNVLLSGVISVPGPGFVVAHGYAEVNIQCEETGYLHSMITSFGIDTVQYMLYPFDDYVRIGSWNECGLDSINIVRYHSVVTERIYPVAGAGYYTYYFIAYRGSSLGYVHVDNPKLLLTYFPTAYGTVETVQ